MKHNLFFLQKLDFQITPTRILVLDWNLFWRKLKRLPTQLRGKGSQGRPFPSHSRCGRNGSLGLQMTFSLKCLTCLTMFVCAGAKAQGYVFVLLSSTTTFCTDLGWEWVPSSLCGGNGLFAQACSTLPRISVTRYSIFSCASGLPSSSVMFFSLELEILAKWVDLV